MNGTMFVDRGHSFVAMPRGHSSVLSADFTAAAPRGRSRLAAFAALLGPRREQPLTQLLPRDGAE